MRAGWKLECPGKQAFSRCSLELHHEQVRVPRRDARTWMRNGNRVRRRKEGIDAQPHTTSRCKVKTMLLIQLYRIPNASRLAREPPGITAGDVPMPAQLARQCISETNVGRECLLSIAGTLSTVSVRADVVTFRTGADCCWRASNVGDVGKRIHPRHATRR